LATVMLAEPAWLVVPVAVSFAEETNVVASGVPFNRTFAPLTNPLPLTVRLKGPSDIDAGTTELSDGAAELTVIVLLALAVGSATLLTVTVTAAEPESGLDGAVYLPAVVIVPIAPALTPDGGVSDHVTAGFVEPATVAVNCRLPFTTTVTGLFGSIVTVTGAAATACAVNHESEATIIAVNTRTLVPPSWWGVVAGSRAARVPILRRRNTAISREGVR